MDIVLGLLWLVIGWAIDAFNWAWGHWPLLLGLYIAYRALSTIDKLQQEMRELQCKVVALENQPRPSSPSSLYNDDD